MYTFQSKDYVILNIYNESNAIICLKCRSKLYTFKNKVVLIYLENLNLFKMGNTNGLGFNIQFWNLKPITWLGSNGDFNQTQNLCFKDLRTWPVT